MPKTTKIFTPTLFWPRKSILWPHITPRIHWLGGWWCQNRFLGPNAPVAPQAPNNQVGRQISNFSITTRDRDFLRPEMETLADLGDSIYIYILFVSQNLKSYMRFSIFRVTAPLRHGNIFWQQKVIFSITTAATGLLRPEMETLADLVDSPCM